MKREREVDGNGRGWKFVKKNQHTSYIGMNSFPVGNVIIMCIYFDSNLDKSQTLNYQSSISKYLSTSVEFSNIFILYMNSAVFLKVTQVGSSGPRTQYLWINIYLIKKLKNRTVRVETGKMHKLEHYYFLRKYVF